MALTMMSKKIKPHAIVIGASAGGLKVLRIILNGQNQYFPLPVILCMHLDSDSCSLLPDVLQCYTAIPVKEAEDKEYISANQLYTAPAAYHLLVEKEFVFGLSVDPPVNYARPAIDVLFESAADAYREHLLGILLTGASCDGAYGLRRIQDFGGVAIVQNPATADYPQMPQAGLECTGTPYCLTPPEIQLLLANTARDWHPEIL